MLNPNGKVLLEVRGLTATVAGVEILKGIDLTVRAGEIHAIMGPNGSGKSTFAKALAGHPAYEVAKGEVRFEGRNLFDMSAEDRARAGLFLGFQYPVEIPGVSRRLTPPATTRSASMSRPESVSSRIASLGSRIAIWRISLRFFSPPEKPSFTLRSRKLGSISSIFIFSRTKSSNSSGSSSSRPRADCTVL